MRSTLKIDPSSSLAFVITESLRELGTVIGEVNVANGWDTSRAMVADPEAFDERWQTSHKIACIGLISTEAAEAIEEVRHGRAMNESYYPHHKPGCELADHHAYGMPGEAPACTCTPKPEGVPSELADVVIRVLDLADAYGIDLGAAIIEKLNHNATRGAHHGGKAL